MSKMSQVFQQMMEELGEDATEEAMGEWFYDYVVNRLPEDDNEDAKNEHT